MTIKKVASLTLAIAFSCGYAHAQAPALQTAVRSAIQRAYAASVRIFPYDSVTNMQTGAPFSGVVVTADGFILTAAHVCEPGHVYKVNFPDGTSVNAKGCAQIALDHIAPDVATMRILPAGQYPFAAMGRTDAVRTGEPCISIACPESLFNPLSTLRFGRIGALQNEKGFMISTCIMEPGDSGGPLFDLMGRVIGLHSAVDTIEAHNFEVPIDLYRRYWTALQHDTVYRVYPTTVDAVPEEDKADSIRYFTALKTSAPALPHARVDLYSNRSGHAAGTLFNGRLIVSKSSQVGDSVWLVKGKKRVPVHVIRRDKANDLVLMEAMEIQEGGLPLQARAALPEPGTFLWTPIVDGAPLRSIMGAAPYEVFKFFSAGSLGAMCGRDLPLKFTMVKPGSVADKAGLRAGDVLQEINGAPVRQVMDFGNQLMACWPGDTVRFVLQRGDSSFTTSVVLAVRTFDVPSHASEHVAGGFSRIRDGFKDKVFSHDAVVTPENCGGPVFGPGGVFCGINIARHSRASVLVMPASVIYTFIGDAAVTR